jgi:exopolysaccharide production protein ExoZ
MKGLGSLFAAGTPATITGGRLISLEAGRFFAALTVMLGHYSGVVTNARGIPVFDNFFDIFHIGVPYFFVLSGFIMFHIHRRDIGRPETIGRFVRKRAVRLLPMFWAISLVMLAGFLLSPALAQERSLTPGGIVADLLLLPHADAILAISWTLRHEVVFYALFALVLWRGPVMLWPIAIWIAVSTIGIPWGHTPRLGSESILASSYNLGFGLGILVAALLHRGLPRRPGLLAAAAAAGMVAMLVLEWMFTRRLAHSAVGFGLTGSLIYLLLSAVLIHGLVALEQRRAIPWERAWAVLGGSSYLLYLIHQPLASLALRVVKPLKMLPPNLVFVILAMLATLAAVVGHLTVERWILARLSPRRRTPVPATA